MARKVSGAFRLVTVFDIDVHLHWTWFLLAFIYVQFNANNQLFSQPIWHLFVLIAIFTIVTLHEFGHALACRSVGGTANTIVLWPLGGIAFVRPPDRPGAVLWSIAAGPLVNVALVPVTLVLVVISGLATPLPTEATTNLRALVAMVTWINLFLLGFNMLPIYPLDGGQVLQSILWFFVGKAKSLLLSGYMGIAGAVLLPFVAMPILGGLDLLLVLIAVFLGWQAYNGLRMARMLAASER